jgi:hypothetical protein
MCAGSNGDRSCRRVAWTDVERVDGRSFVWRVAGDREQGLKVPRDEQLRSLPARMRTVNPKRYLDDGWGGAEFNPQ